MYHIANINGLKSEPKYMGTHVLTKQRYDEGYRITQHTLGLCDNRYPSVVHRLINNYQFGTCTISLEWIANISKGSRGSNSIFSGDMNVSFHLKSINLFKNGKNINDKLPNNIITDLNRQINNKLPNQYSHVKYIEIDIVNSLFPDKYNKLFEYLNGLAENLNNNFKVTEQKIMSPSDITLVCHIINDI